VDPTLTLILATVAFLGIHTWMLQAILPAAFALITYRTFLAILLAREASEVEAGGAE